MVQATKSLYVLSPVFATYNGVSLINVCGLSWLGWVRLIKLNFVEEYCLYIYRRVIVITGIKQILGFIRFRFHIISNGYSNRPIVKKICYSAWCLFRKIGAFPLIEAGGPYVHTPPGIKRGPVSTAVPNANCTTLFIGHKINLKDLHSLLTPLTTHNSLLTHFTSPGLKFIVNVFTFFSIFIKYSRSASLMLSLR